MKNYLIIFLSLIAEFNAIYLTQSAYNLKWQQETSNWFCDINETLSCSSVFNFDFAWFFWLPFSALAIWVYWLVILITVLWMKWKIRNHFRYLFWIWIAWLWFNWYIIFNEYFVNTYCLLCAMCTVIMAFITYTAFKNMRAKKPTQVISV